MQSNSTQTAEHSASERNHSASSEVVAVPETAAKKKIRASSLFHTLVQDASELSRTISEPAAREEFLKAMRSHADEIPEWLWARGLNFVSDNYSDDAALFFENIVSESNVRPSILLLLAASSANWGRISSAIDLLVLASDRVTAHEDHAAKFDKAAKPILPHLTVETAQILAQVRWFGQLTTSKIAKALANAGKQDLVVAYLEGSLFFPNLPGRLALHYFEGLRALQRPMEEQRACIQRALKENPNDRVLFSEWEKKYRPGQESLLDDVMSLQAESSQFLGAAFLRLDELGIEFRSDPRLETNLRNISDGPLFSAFEAVWQSCCTFNEIDELSAQTVTSAALSQVNNRLLAFPLDFKLASLDELLSETGKAAKNSQFHAKALASYAETLTVLTDAWETTIETADLASDDARETIPSVDQFCCFQDRIVANRNFGIRDPYTARIVYPVDSFAFNGRNIFYFAGSVPFYALAASSGSKLAAIWIPSHSVIIDFRAGISKYFSPRILNNTIAFILKRAAKHYQLHNAAVARARQGYNWSRPRNIVINIQQTANFAHHVWNFYSGLQRIVDTVGTSNIDSVLFGATEFYGPLEGLFPELAGKIQLVDSTTVDVCPYSEDRLLVTAGGYFISAALRDRVCSAMAAHPRTPNSISPEDFTSHGPVIWLGIRVGDKSWLGQTDGLVKLAKGVLQQHPDAIVLIDGFSFPVGKDYITHAWRGALDRLRAIGDSIVQNVGSDRVLNVIGNTLRESVLWAQRTNAYIAPVGTSQHKVGWFSAGEGIVYLSKGELEQVRPERLPGAWEAEGMRMPKFVFGDPVDDGERKNINDSRLNISNVELDSDHLLKLLLEAIEISLGRENPGTLHGQLPA